MVLVGEVTAPPNDTVGSREVHHVWATFSSPRPTTPRYYFAAAAGVAEALARGQSRGDLQAHLAVPRVPELAAASTSASLLRRTSNSSAVSGRDNAAHVRQSGSRD